MIQGTALQHVQNQAAAVSETQKASTVSWTHLGLVRRVGCGGRSGGRCHWQMQIPSCCFGRDVSLDSKRHCVVHRRTWRAGCRVVRLVARC